MSAQTYKNRFDGTKVQARQIGRFMRLVSVMKGVVHGQVGDYIVRDRRNGEIYFMRKSIFEYEYEKTRG